MSGHSSKMKGIRQSLGPSLLWAGAAIGVSHLVQSTRAGADYHYFLIWAVVLAFVFKYPFFEAGPRYAAATGESLLVGYKRLGNWTLGVFIAITITTMFTVVAAVTLVTAGIVGYMFKSLGELSLGIWSGILLAVCMVVLIIGRYSYLDKLIKGIIVVLALSTVIAVIAAMVHGGVAQPHLASVREGGVIGAGNFVPAITFIVVLVGWMPSPIDLSVWNSIWTLEKKEETGHAPKVKEALIDFNIAYFITAFLAICFLTLGAIVMYGTGEEFSKGGVAFAGQFIHLYTTTLGTWSYPIIALAALATMFSTTLTCTDGYSRVLRLTTELVFPSRAVGRGGGSRVYIFWMVVVVGGGLVLIYAFLNKQMAFMVDLATTISFLTAPVLGYLNYRLVTSRHMPEHAMPSIWLRALGILGIAFLTAFSVLFIYSKLYL